MARTTDELPKGIRLTDHISLGVIAKTFPRDRIDVALERAGKASRRQRALPAHVVGAPGRARTLGGESPLQARQRELLAGRQGCPSRGGI